ncbi:hypothetical protein T265_04829 [Opisthorchis viverrini]|uniref:Large ribosomal subunit protein mL53 n=1 Tax=Opisthorchis viverrini TaxID=6198 RepID=A0A074ZR56_OPIVI|nr:hypothetical protein T265_04829 [Opisthorchis viverrini]KER28297.1 hypothetical protein T265_04829 [Opisthorchis viverrini]
MSLIKYRNLPRRVKYLRPLRAVDESVVSKDILKKLDFKPVKSICFSFNPFVGRTESIREACRILSNPRWRSTNTNLVFKARVLSDNHAPVIEVVYSNGNIVLIKTDNLSIREIIDIIYAQSLVNPHE